MPSAKPNQPFPSSLLTPAPLVSQIFLAKALPYLPYTSAAALSRMTRPSSLRRKAPKTAQLLCNLSRLESTLLQVFILKNLISFRINTYKKQGGGVGRSPSRKLFTRPTRTNPEDSTSALTP